MPYSASLVTYEEFLEPNLGLLVPHEGFLESYLRLVVPYEGVLSYIWSSGTTWGDPGAIFGVFGTMLAGPWSILGPCVTV